MICCCCCCCMYIFRGGGCCKSEFGGMGLCGAAFCSEWFKFSTGLCVISRSGSGSEAESSSVLGNRLGSAVSFGGSGGMTRRQAIHVTTATPPRPTPTAHMFLSVGATLLVNSQFEVCMEALTNSPTRETAVTTSICHVLRLLQSHPFEPASRVASTGSRYVSPTSARLGVQCMTAADRDHRKKRQIPVAHVQVSST